MNEENFMELAVLRNKTLLVLTSCYPDKNGKITGDPFVKGQVDEIKNYFNNCCSYLLLSAQNIATLVRAKKNDRHRLIHLHRHRHQ